MEAILGKNWKIILGTALAGSLAYLLLRKKEDEEQENFLGSPMNKVVNITLKNNTATQQTQNLFNAFTDFTNPNVGTAIMGSSLSEFNKSLLSEPIRVNQIEVKATGANQSTQSQNTITKMCKDASGVSSTDFYYPMVSPNQFQSGITIVQPPNLILDGGCFLQYPVEANTTVNLILRYDVVGKQSAKLPTTTTSNDIPVQVKYKSKKKKKKSFFWF